MKTKTIIKNLSNKGFTPDMWEWQLLFESLKKSFYKDLLDCHKIGLGLTIKTFHV